MCQSTLPLVRRAAHPNIIPTNITVAMLVFLHAYCVYLPHNARHALMGTTSTWPLRFAIQFARQIRFCK